MKGFVKIIGITILAFIANVATAQNSNFYPNENTYYKIKTNDGKYVTVNGTAKAEANVNLTATKKGDAQLFKFIREPNGSHYLVETKLKKGLYLTVDYSKTTPNTNIKLNSRKGNNQYFRMMKNGSSIEIYSKLGTTVFLGANNAKDNLVIQDYKNRGNFKFEKVKTPVTGKDVVFVECSKNGNVIGSFQEIGEKKWAEYKVNKRGQIHATFTETNRDAWSVYLFDKSRGIKVQLDLYTKKVKVNGSPYFDVTNSKSMQWFPYNPPKNTSTESYTFTLQTMNLSKFPELIKNNYDYSETYYLSYSSGYNVLIRNALERTVIEWEFEDQGNGYYRLKNRSNKYLSVHNSGKTDGTNLKTNNRVNGSNQEFRFEQNAQGYVRIVSKLGKGLYVGHAKVSNGNGNLILRKGDKGYNTTFKLIPNRTISSKATGTLELFAEQYAAPVSNEPITQAQLNGFHTIVYRDGVLQQVSGQKDWVRLDGNKKVVDVLKETSRKNGHIYLQTYNSFVYNYPLNLTASHQAYYDININMEMKRVEKFHNDYIGKSSISATSDKYYDLGKSGTGTACNDFRVITFRGMVTLAYATNNVWGKSDKMCSGPAANREKEMFKSACLEHDKNWSAPWKLAGYNNEAGQSISDAIFLMDLKGIVDGSSNPIDHTAVGFFYRGVRSTKQGNNNYGKGRQHENEYHRVIFTAEKKTKDILTNIVDEEYSEDMIDYIFVGGEAVKNFFEDDVAGFFSDLF